MQNILVGHREVSPQARTLDEMQPVIFDREWLKKADLRQPLYFMYRDCILPEDQETARHLGIRYDITVLLPVRLGREFNKTKGHYHSEKQLGLAYPELYEVLEGEALILLQRREGSGVNDVIALTARAGDKMIVPPNYGHVTVNIGDTPLKMANWVSTRVESYYGPYEEKNGAAYWVLTPERAGDRPKYLANIRYGRLPQLRLLSACEVPDLHLTRQTPSYALIESPPSLRFLNYPEEFSDLWPRLYPR
jgi:glucose-6-phosphate isomerase